MTRLGAPLRLAALAALTPALAAGPPPSASSCSGCHAMRPAASSVVPPIHGRSEAEIVAAMDAFRSGGGSATVMNRIAPGFTPDETRAIAAWLSRQPVPR